MKNTYICIILCFFFLGNSIAQSQFDFALNLDGNSDYVDFGNVTESNFVKSDFTIEFWMNKPTSRIEAIIGKREHCSNSNFWNSRIATTINFELDQTNTGVNYLNLSGAENVADSNWHHIAITRRGPDIKLYLDGVLDQTGSSDDTTSLSNAASLLVGQNPCVGTADGTRNFSGQIDEIRLWRIARTSDQIKSTMNDTLSPEYYSSTDSSLFGYWRFDELEDLGIFSDGADDVRDFSIYENHGDLVGDASLIQSDILVSIENTIVKSPEKFLLNQNYPNPFNPTTTISYILTAESDVTLAVYDISGREVYAVVNGKQPGGRHEIAFDASNLSSGIYIYKMTTNIGFTQNRKMIILK